MHELLVRRRELLGMLLGQVGEVEAGARQIVFGLTHVHPEAVEIECVKLALSCKSREDFLLDRGGLDLDALEDRGVEDVDAGVDAVADKFLGLLYEAVDSGLAGDLNHDTILGGLIDLGDLQHVTGDFVQRLGFST